MPPDARSVPVPSSRRRLTLAEYLEIAEEQIAARSPSYLAHVAEKGEAGARAWTLRLARELHELDTGAA